jgi:tetratricopeptide (TPR) repeat protein
MLLLLLGFPLSVALRDLKAEQLERQAKSEQLQNHFDEAIAFYREAIRVSPADARLALAHAELARSLWIFRDTPELKAEADDAFNEAKRLSPHWPMPHYQHARMYSFKGQYKQALLLLSPALQLDPNNAGYWLERARYLEKLGMLKEAAAAYARCWALDTVSECDIGMNRLRNGL